MAREGAPTAGSPPWPVRGRRGVPEGVRTAPLLSVARFNPRSGAGTVRQPNPGQLRSSGGLGEAASGAELRAAGGRDGAPAHGNRPSLSLVAGGCGFGAELEVQCMYTMKEVGKLPEAAARLYRSWTSLLQSSEPFRRVPMGGEKKTQNQSNKITTKKSKAVS